MSNKFCKFLSNGYRIHSYGTTLKYKPCCWYRDEIDIIQDPEWQEKKKLISQINDWTPACGCRSIEDNNPKHSPRLRSFNTIPDNVPDNAASWIELSLDLTCNAACIMCYPGNSSTWWKQELKFGWITTDDVPNFVDPAELLDQLTKLIPLDQLSTIDFLGGEPFQSEVPYLFLKHLKQIQGSLKNIQVMFQTNGSIMPEEKLLELLSECKTVSINTSIDGIGKQFEYIRYPLSWNKVESNLLSLKNLNMPTFVFKFLFTANPFNAYYYDSVNDWCRENFGPDTEAVLNRSGGKIDLIHNTPPELKNMLMSHLGENHPISKLIKDARYSSSCIPYVDKLDSCRGNSWREVFPDIVNYLEPKNKLTQASTNTTK